MATVRTKRWNDPPGAEDGTRIFVARYRPRFLRKGAEPWAEWIRELAPSKELHADWHGKGGRRRIDFAEFLARYRDEMKDQQEAIDALARRTVAGEPLTFLCYCADETRCHRTLLKWMVEEVVRHLQQKE